MGKMTAENRKKRDENRLLTMSPQKNIEAGHLAGKHKTESFESCGFCQRRTFRDIRKAEKTKAFFARNKSK